MFKSRWTKTIIVLAPLAVLSACAPVVPPELVSARNAYARALQGPAGSLAPAEVHKARESLDVAERSFADRPKAQITRDLAYVAERKAEEAEALGVAAQSREVRKDHERAYVVMQGQILGRARSEAELAKMDAERAKNDAAYARTEVERQRMAAELARNEVERSRDELLKTERERGALEMRAKEAEAELEKLEAKVEKRGTVITLNGSVLFASNQATLLPSGEKRLEEVAHALMASKDRRVVVEGYTDSRGSDSHNVELSRRRAQAVRDYLVSKGYDPDLIVATGFGKARPIADNASAEGRANNRRVEIVIQPKKAD